MSELSDYIRCVSGPHEEALNARIGKLSARVRELEAAALRQEPSVDEVLRGFVDDMLHGYNVNHTSKFVRDKAQAIASLYRGKP